MSGDRTEEGPGAARIDRWLFGVRLFKSRSLAAQAVTGGKVFSMVLDNELDPEHFLPTLTLQGPYRADKPPVTDAVAARAIQIADEAMEELLRSHACPIESLDSSDIETFGLVDADGSEVSTLNEADPAIIEAFKWLQERGLAELAADEDGEYIQLKGGE